MRTSKDIRSLWLRTFYPSDKAQIQLVCFPHAGGTANFYRRLASLLVPQVEIVAVQYLGREDRIFDEAICDIHVLSSVIANILGESDNRKIALLGHSMGAIVAYEVATRLENFNLSILQLFVSGQTSPINIKKTSFHRVDDSKLVKEIIRLSDMPTSIFDNAELREILLTAIRSDYKAIETYSCTSFSELYCPIAVLLGNNDTEVFLEDAVIWQKFSCQKITTHVFNGGHFFINNNLCDIADLIRENLLASLRKQEATSIKMDALESRHA